MSKFTCLCGSIISDSSDFESYKARYIADQDYYDFLDEYQQTITERQFHVFSRYTREIFQCSTCHNLIVFSKGERFDFNPLTLGADNLLLSRSGKNWKGMMSATFRQQSGEIYWQTNQDQGFRQHLSLSELKELYYRKFEELKTLNILRHAHLTINGVTEHQFDINTSKQE